MTNLNDQPFLFSMKREMEQISDLEGHKTLLQAQQSAFKTYLSECCHSEIPAPERFEFLSIADYEVCSLRLLYTDKIRENNDGFYRFWSILLADTRRFISAGIKTLEFQISCPAYLLTKPTPTFPSFTWTGTRTDLMEALVGIYLAGVIRLKNGARPSFTLFVNFIGHFFGITYKHPSDEMRKVLGRKRDQTPFFHRVIKCMKDKDAKHYE